MANVLVIDIGTSSMRGILFSQKGVNLASLQIKYQPVHEPDGVIWQDPKDWESACIKIIRHIAAQAEELGKSIDALAFTSQRSSVMPVNMSGEPLMPAIMWQDTRNKEICRELGEQDSLIFAKCGAKVNTLFSGAKMAWVVRNCPDIIKKTWKFLNIPEYLIYKITGKCGTDYTYASRSNLLNLRTKQWDEELLKLFGVKEEWLCKLQEPGSILGKITESFADESGLPTGLPVISAGGDQQCAAVGQGVYRQGNLSVVTGTGAFLITACEQIPEKLNENLICNFSSVKNQYVLESNVLTCCSAFDWFCHNFYGEDSANYDMIDRELEELYDKRGNCIVLPYFQGRSAPSWNPEAKATFHNVTLGTGRGEMLKALLEGIFIEICNNLELFRCYVDIDSIYASGGMTNSNIMNQMQADICGLPLYHMKNSESTALGALMVALSGMGIYSSVEEAFRSIRGKESVEVYQPNNEKHVWYLERKKEMGCLYEKLYDECKENAK